MLEDYFTEGLGSGPLQTVSRQLLVRRYGHAIGDSSCRDNIVCLASSLKPDASGKEDQRPRLVFQFTGVATFCAWP